MSYQDEYTERIIENPERNSIVSRLARYAWKHGMYVFILVERLRHMDVLSKRLSDVPHKLVAGTVRGEHMEVKLRMKALKRFEKGKLRLVIANRVFKKGVDVKRLDVIISCAALKSKNDAIQIFGRGVRKHELKKGLLFFDLADYDPRAPRIKLLNRGRKKKLKPHRFHLSAQSRLRAYKAAGIPVKDFQWEEDGEVKELFRTARKMLKKELRRGKKSKEDS